MNKHILIVEDDEAISRLIKLNLEIAGYKSTQVFSGTEILHCLEQDKVDLILLDVMLPGIDGANGNLAYIYVWRALDFN